MRGGLYPLGVIAEFLGRKPEDVVKMIQDDELPVIPVPTDQKTINKVSLLGFHRWLAKRTINRALSVDELAEELERAGQAVIERSRAKRDRQLKMKDEGGRRKDENRKERAA